MRVIFVLLLSLLLSACGAETHPEKTASIPGSHNPTPEEVLAHEPSAELFKFEGVTYKKAELRDDLTKYKPGSIIGKITKHYQPGQPFENWTATQLPIGTEIYDTDPKSGPVLIEG